MISFWLGHFVLHDETPVQTSSLRPLPLQHTSHTLFISPSFGVHLCAPNSDYLFWQTIIHLLVSLSLTQWLDYRTSSPPWPDFPPHPLWTSDQSCDSSQIRIRILLLNKKNLLWWWYVKKKLQILKLMSFSSGSPGTEDKCLCPWRGYRPLRG